MYAVRNSLPKGVLPVRMVVMNSSSVHVGNVDPPPKVMFGAGGQLDGKPGITPPDMVVP